MNRVLLIVTVASISLEIRAADIHREDLFENPCELSLTGLFLKKSAFVRNHFSGLFNNYTIEEFPDKRGFELRHDYTEGAEPPETVDFSIDPAPVQFWSSQGWDFYGQPFQFIDVGFKNLQSEVDKTGFLVIQHIFAHGHDLTIRYSPQWLTARETLKVLRWTLHKSVLEKYRVRKPYLDSVQIEDLNLPNTVSGNSDVFGLLAGPPSPVANLTVKDVQSRLILTAQITYHGNRHFQQPPTLRGMYASMGYIVDEDLDKFPFEYRIQGSEFDEFRRQFYSRFPVRTTCEINRYAMFGNKLPLAVHERFLYHMLKTAENRGMKAIIAEVDSKTARLFGRYGFRVFAQLPSIQLQESEYVVYVEKGTPEWNKTMERFNQSLSYVRVEKLEPK
jgi:hypothetical protein